MSQAGARRYLLAYLAAVVAITLLHSPWLLGTLLLAALAAAGKARWALLRRSLKAIVLFNLSISLGLIVAGLWQGSIDAEALIRLNLRVVLLVFLGFWFIRRVNLLHALAGWPLLTWIASLALGQIRLFERLLREFSLAFTSRNPTPPRPIDQARHVLAQGTTLLDKSLAQSTMATLALRSRGVFDDDA